MKRTHQEVDEILKDSKEYIRDYFMGKKEIEIPENFLRKSFENTAENINKYVPDLVNTKWIPEVNENCMKKLFKSEQKTPKHIANNTPKEVVEKTFILNFFKELPIESLKKLINFKEIDFENSELWNDPKNREILSQLRDENVVKYTCELSLDYES